MKLLGGKVRQAGSKIKIEVGEKYTFKLAVNLSEFENATFFLKKGMSSNFHKQKAESV